MAVKGDVVNYGVDGKHIWQEFSFIGIRLFTMKEAQWINTRIRISLRGIDLYFVILSLQYYFVVSVWSYYKNSSYLFSFFCVCRYFLTSGWFIFWNKTCFCLRSYQGALLVCIFQVIICSFFVDVALLSGWWRRRYYQYVSVLSYLLWRKWVNSESFTKYKIDKRSIWGTKSLDF